VVGVAETVVEDDGPVRLTSTVEDWQAPTISAMSRMDRMGI
jgi:hypothetical protein